MAQLHHHGMRQCTQCGRLAPDDRGCRACSVPEPEEQRSTACAGWGCPLREGCAHYVASSAAGAATLAWQEPPYDHLAKRCPEYRAVMSMAAVVDLLAVTLRRTIGRQNQN